MCLVGRLLGWLWLERMVARSLDGWDGMGWVGLGGGRVCVPSIQFLCQSNEINTNAKRHFLPPFAFTIQESELIINLRSPATNSLAHRQFQLLIHFYSPMHGWCCCCRCCFFNRNIIKLVSVFLSCISFVVSYSISFHCAHVSVRACVHYLLGRVNIPKQTKNWNRNRNRKSATEQKTNGERNQAETVFRH